MSSEKTETPTDKKLRDARRRGEVPKSRELVAAAGLLGACAGLVAFGARAANGMAALLEGGALAAARPSSAALVPALASALSAGLTLVAPIMLITLGFGVSSAYLQVGALFAPGRIAPRLDHLDPTKGFRRIFSKASVVELAKSFVVLAILVHIAWGALADGTTGIARAAALGPASLLEAAGALVLRVMLRTGVALLAIGIVDFFYQRHRHVQDQRMTKDEVKREHREADGDPQSKQQRARMHQEIVEHAAVEEVRLADVLVVNPTHYAVALSFDREGEQDAPEVRAKGVDHLARRMIEAARESGVPVLRDIPLAHALYALEVGEQIPEALYEATAAVLQAAWDEREGSNP